GNIISRAGELANYQELALSPDGTRVASYRPDQQGDIWLYEFARGTTTRLTFGPTPDRFPVWSPDGNRIAFASGRSGNLSHLYWKNADGTGEEELLFMSNLPKTPTSWSRDGRFLLFGMTDPTSSSDIWVLPLEGDRKPVPFLQTQFVEGQAMFSPDGRWIAYTSNESGRPEVYVRPFVNPD